MHAAPSVTYPVGRSAFALRVYAMAAAAGLAAAMVWTVQSGTFGWRQALALAAVLAGGAAAGVGWLRSPTGALRWDGAGWSWEAGGQVRSGHPEIAFDLQNRLVLRWQGEGARASWFWLERAADPMHWEALRRAVYSRASAPSPPFPPGGKGSPPAGQPPTAEQ
jgi:toxin CptA